MAIIIIRTLTVYFTLLLTMRLLGKRQLGEMELSEFVLAALVADLAALPLQDLGIPMLNGLVPIATLFFCEILIAGASMKSIRLRTLLSGKPSLLIVRGRIDQKELFKNRFTVDELLQELRNQGCLDPGQVQYAILETDGRLNVILFPQHKPPSSGQLGVATDPEAYPSVIISDGRIIENNLRSLGHDIRWLNKELKRQGHKEPGEIFLMTMDKTGHIYLSEKERSK